MKSVILFITLSLVLFSCGNDSAPTNTNSIEGSDILTPVTTPISKTKETLNEIHADSISDILENETSQNTELQTVLETVEIETISNNNTILETELPTTPAVIETVTEEVIDVVEDEEVLNTPNHDSWNAILKSNVSSSGKVNYVGMKSKLTEIQSYISTLESLSDQSTWSRNEKLAYWINLYNAATVKLIVDNYPTSSITNINGGKPWDKKVVTISGKSYSLNQIENDIIRPKFKEPRIHFAVNCAAISCPKIMNSAFTADKLSYQLTKQAKAFINGSKNSISENSIEISKIFEWYAVDFGSSIIDYLNKYSTTTINSNATTTYNEYNWNLNK